MAPFVRILLRYASMPFVLLGWILPEEQAEIIADPEVVFYVTQAVGFGTAALVEGWYFFAKRMGWST